MAALFFTNFFHYFYVPSSGPWYAGNVWGNVFVIAVVAPLGWLWSKSKFWPLRPIKHGITALHTKADRAARSLEGLHQKHEQNSKDMEELTASVASLHKKHDKLSRALARSLGGTVMREHQKELDSSQ